MIERDYLMRLIDVLVKSLARVLLHKEVHDYSKALLEIDTTCKTLLGMGCDIIRRFSDTQLIELLGRDPETADARCYVLGALLKEEGEIMQLQGKQQEAVELLVRSLSFLITPLLKVRSPVESKHASLIEDVMQQLQSCELPMDIKEKVFGYCEFVGKYDKAEDRLFELLEADRRYADIGLSFYERLLKKSDDELAHGNLPRSEVMEGILSLKRLKAVP